jgi:hypothetical protein
MLEIAKVSLAKFKKLGRLEFWASPSTTSTCNAYANMMNLLMLKGTATSIFRSERQLSNIFAAPESCSVSKIEIQIFALSWRI